MRSIISVYKIGNGPSSSHTVGPYNAAEYFKEKYPDADAYKVICYGSLAYTGEGHGTGKAILSAIPKAELILNTTETDLPHPNTMDFIAYKESTEIGKMRIMSVGGGSIRIDGEMSEEDIDVYPEKNFREISELCKKDNISLKDYIFSHESEKLRPYLIKIWHTMEECVQRGLVAEGILPGGLNLPRKAKSLYTMRCRNESSDIAMDRTIASYAYAVNEENADEHLVVTAPTCGSCGIIPSIFYYMRHDKGYSEDEIIDALAVAALIGNVIRTNASVSGAECGCQAEIGSACSMAAAGFAYLNELSIDEIECAAEIAMEHHLGLTCDPVKGLVQIPCIERNAVAAMRAINAVNLARFLSPTKQISLDEVITTMYETGIDMDERYRETAHGGLSQIHGIYSKYGPEFGDCFFERKKL